MFNTLNRPPEAIIAVCFVMLAISLFDIYSILKTDLSQFSLLHLVLIVASMTITLASIVGIWMMRRWGVYLFACVFLASQANMLAQGQWSIGVILLPLLILTVTGAHFKRMS